MNRYRVLLPLLCLLLAAAPPAVGYEPQERVGALLEPGPDGLYAVPREDAPAMPLEDRVEEDSPFVLHELRYVAETGKLHAVLANTGDKPVTAVAVELALLSPEGELLTSTRKTEDWAGAVDRAALERWEETGHAPIDPDDGVVFPGESYGLKLGGFQEGEVPADRLMVSVPVTVFADASFTGSGNAARQILQSRVERARELSSWSNRLEEAVRRDLTEEQALATLRSLHEELLEDAGPPQGRAGLTRASIRRNLESALDDVAEQRSSAREELERLAAMLRLDVRDALPHLPEDALEAS